MSVQDRRGAAYHEAGHVVVAWALGLAVRKIEIAVGGDPTAGKAEIERSDRLPLVDQIAICVAGLEAQEIFGAFTHGHAAMGDYAKIIELVEELDETTISAQREAGCLCARELIEHHRSLIDQIAAYLIANGTIDQEIIDSLLPARI